MHQNILNFFQDRKDQYIKSKINSTSSDNDRSKISSEAEEKFNLQNWLPDASKRVTQLSMVSHPSKFSHPNAKTSSIIASNVRLNDGYLRSGNVNSELDVIGNAASMDVFKFLSLVIDDELTILDHLEKDSDAIKKVFSNSNEKYENLKSGFIRIKELSKVIKTDHLVKQVYFPISTSYNLLSILTPSGLLAQIKDRVDNMRTEQSFEARENKRKNEFSVLGYDDLFNLTVIGYGGTQPQNVSVLNSRNAGRSYLLPSIPPNFHYRNIRLPKYEFFKNCLNPKHFKEGFLALHSLMMAPVNNMAIREGISNTLKFIVDQVLYSVFKIRNHGIGWSNSDHYQALPLEQRIWLDDFYKEKRIKDDDWINPISQNFSVWIIKNYELICKNDHLNLGDKELQEIIKYINEAIMNDKDLYR